MSLGADALEILHTLIKHKTNVSKNAPQELSEYQEYVPLVRAGAQAASLIVFTRGPISLARVVPWETALASAMSKTASTAPPMLTNASNVLLSMLSQVMATASGNAAPLRNTWSRTQALGTARIYQSIVQRMTWWEACTTENPTMFERNAPMENSFKKDSALRHVSQA